MASLRRALVLLLAATLVNVPAPAATAGGGSSSAAPTVPAVDWSPGPVVLVHDQVRFTLADDVDGRVEWIFPDGTIETGETATHRFAASGNRTVTVVVSDDGASASEEVTVPVQRYYRRDQVVKKEAFIEVSGTMDLEAEYDGQEYASSEQVAPEGTPLLNDDIHIDATIYYPDPNVTRGPWPAMISTPGWGVQKYQYEGYGGSFAEEGMGSYAQEGYVGLVYNVRGVANSSGYQRAYDPDQEIADVSDIISWLADDAAHDGDWYSGRGFRPGNHLDFQVEKDAPGDPVVGMLGQSNGGITTLLAAGQDRRLDAAAAGGVYHNLTFSMLPGGVPKSVLIAGILASANLQAGARQLRDGNVRTWLKHPEIWGTTDTEIPLWSAQGFTGLEGDLREDFRRRSPMTYNDRITSPVFLSHGWMDQFFEPPNPLHNYRQIATNPHFSSMPDEKRDRRVKLVMEPEGHDYYEHKVQDMRVLWFHHFLKGHPLDGTYRGVVDRYNGDNPSDRVNEVTLPAVEYRHVVEQPPILFHENHPDDVREVSMGQDQEDGHPGTDYPWYDQASLQRWVQSSPDHWYDPYTGFHCRAYDDPIWAAESPEKFYLRAGNHLSRSPPPSGLLASPPDAIANVPASGWTTYTPAPGGARSGTPYEQLDHAPAATVSYATDALQQDVTLVGHGKAKLDVVLTANGPLDSGSGDAHFVVKVWDRSPSGEYQFVTRGYKAVGLEDLAQEGEAVVREVEVPLYSMDRVLPKGHQLVVQVTHSDILYVAPSAVPHGTLVRHTAENPSFVELPTRTDAELAGFAAARAGG